MGRRIYIGTASTPAAANVDTAGEGYFIGATVVLSESVAGSIVAAIDEARAYQFVLPLRVKVAQITYWITTGGGVGTFLGIGIYDKDKNLLLETGAVDGNAIGQATASITAVTLEPGVYWVAWTADSATIQLAAVRNLHTASPLINEVTPRFGIAANAGSVGVLPATLGTITASTNRGVLQAVFGS